MQTRHTDAIPLAPRPSLEQYKTLAKDLVKASRNGDVESIRAWSSDWIERLARLETGTPTPEYTVAAEPRHLDWKRINHTVDGIIRDMRESRLLPSDSVAANPRLAEAQLVIARLHGFDSWPKFVHHIEARDNANSPESQFESAADAIVTGDLAKLDALVRRNPSLVHARSTRDHHATLLHYVAANGHEGFRQRTPKNAVGLARVLLEAGADPDALADMYGHRCTTMEMLVSSVHPHVAGVQVALAEALLDFGAAVDGVELNGSPLMTAFRFHYPKAADALVRRGARVDNVISAAAVGRVDLVDAFVDDRGMLRPDVPLADVPWPHLPKDPAVHLGYALTWGATFGPSEVVELLLRKGVDPSGKDDDASALHFAAAYGRMDLVRLLLKYGASLETRNSYDGTVLSGTLWYAHNAAIEGVDYAAVVRELIELGARVDVYPEMQENVNVVVLNWGNEVRAKTAAAAKK
jgi:ankyrin repeat protein